MPLVETLEVAIRNRLHELSEAAATRYSKAVRAVLISTNGLDPEFVGSSILIAIDKRRYVVTAAHILDNLDTHAVFVSGTVGTQPVQLLGEMYMTSRPAGGRSDDKIDIGFWEIDDTAVEKLGAVDFIDSRQFAENGPPESDKHYLAMGYPISRNRRNINHARKSIKTNLVKYTGQLNCDPSIAEENQFSVDKHLFLKYRKFSQTGDGIKQKTFKPNGLSGAPIICLGDLSSPRRFMDNHQEVGQLTGIIIEKIEKHRVLVATRIQIIVDAIRRNQETSLRQQHGPMDSSQPSDR